MLSFGFMKKKWLEQCPDEFKPVYYRRYVGDIFSNVFRFKDRLPYDLVSCAVCKFKCGRCNASCYGEN